MGSEEDTWHLEMELLRLPSSGGTVAQMQKLATRIAAGCDGVPQHVRELGHLPTSTHRKRDLHRWVFKQEWRKLMPDPYNFAIPYTPDGIQETTAEHAAFLPHERFASLSGYPELSAELLVGQSGNLTNSWQKTADTSWYQRHPLPELHLYPSLCVCADRSSRG